MNTGLQASGLFAVLLLLAFFGWFFANTAGQLALDANTLSKLPDTQVQQLTIQQFDSQGVLTHQLDAPIMRHTPLHNQHWFKNPHIILTQVNQPAWTIQANQATAFEGGEKIILEGAVRIHQDAAEKTTESTLTTEEITYFPKDKKAVAHQAVRYEQPGSQVNSWGMIGLLSEKRIQLHQAQGFYEPKKD